MCNLKIILFIALLGAKVATGIENGIKTSTFSSGIYILKLDFDRGTVTVKVIIN